MYLYVLPIAPNHHTASVNRGVTLRTICKRNRTITNVFKAQTINHMERQSD